MQYFLSIQEHTLFQVFTNHDFRYFRVRDLIFVQGRFGETRSFTSTSEALRCTSEEVVGMEKSNKVLRLNLINDYMHPRGCFFNLVMVSQEFELTKK